MIKILEHSKFHVSLFSINLIITYREFSTSNTVNRVVLNPPLLFKLTYVIFTLRITSDFEVFTSRRKEKAEKYIYISHQIGRIQ